MIGETTDCFGYYQSTTTSASKELTSVYETQLTLEINMSQEGEGPHLDNKE